MNPWQLSSQPGKTTTQLILPYLIPLALLSSYNSRSALWKYNHLFVYEPSATSNGNLQPTRGRLLVFIYLGTNWARNLSMCLTLGTHTIPIGWLDLLMILKLGICYKCPEARWTSAVIRACFPIWQRWAIIFAGGHLMNFAVVTGWGWGLASSHVVWGRRLWIKNTVKGSCPCCYCLAWQPPGYCSYLKALSLWLLLG